MKKIVLITSRFPYSGGEQFLETEVEYYKSEALSLTILPIVKGNEKREISNKIEVKDIFLNDNWNKSKSLYLLKGLLSKEFYKEFFFYNMFNVKKIKIFFSSLMLHQFYMEKLTVFLDDSTDLKNTVFYTYWNNEATYALQSLKKKYGYKVISRIHGGDIYEERRALGYFPLKKQFTHNIDKIYTITSSANQYLIERYGFNKKNIELSRLGVKDLNIISLPMDTNCLHIASCSSCIALKRIDKIIDTLVELSVEKPQLDIIWTHIGDGELREDLENLAYEKFKNKERITFSFLGNLANVEVYEFYQNNAVDVFINVSQSEGVPVSIMEALSCHIPIVAPNIGGIADMVTSNYNGQLLSSQADIVEIVKVLKDDEFFKLSSTRENAYKVFLEKYDASLNYINFVTSIKEL